MKLKSMALAGAALSAAMLVSAPASAEVAIVGFTGGTTFNAFSSNETIGFVFRANDDMRVTALGWYGASGTLNSAHRVGLWSSTGTLLGSAIVTPGATGASLFRYVALPTTLLTAGQVYFIGGVDTATDGDTYVTSVTSLTTDAAVSFLGSAVSANGSGFAFPNRINTITLGGRFGPNFEFTPGIPEPATWAFMILGFGVIGGALRRRKANVTTSVRYA
jgi:hypothetical protein